MARSELTVVIRFQRLAEQFLVFTIVKITGMRRFFGTGTCSNGFLAHLDLGAWGIPGDVSVQ